MVLPLDLSKVSVQKQIPASYASILRFFGRSSIDMLINNAGIVQDGLTDEVPFDDIRDVFNVNLVSPAILTRAVLPDMLKADCGHVVNISSVTAYFQNGAMSIYAASKNGLISLSKVLQTEAAFLSPNVRCTLCILGAINTGIDQRAKAADGSVGSETWLKWGKIESGISPKRCAQLICTATSQRMKEVWISKHP